MSRFEGVGLSRSNQDLVQDGTYLFGIFFAIGFGWSAQLSFENGRSRHFGGRRNRSGGGGTGRQRRASRRRGRHRGGAFRRNPLEVKLDVGADLLAKRADALAESCPVQLSKANVNRWNSNPRPGIFCLTMYPRIWAWQFNIIHHLQLPTMASKMKIASNRVKHETE